LLSCFAGCQQQEHAHNHASERTQHNKDKHRIAADNLRGWNTYPIIVLVAAKHRIGADTVAQLAQRFDTLFDGMGVDVEAKLPEPIVSYDEELLPSTSVPNFFKAQQQAFGLSTLEVAEILNDFYLLGGSNRTYPDPVPNE
jgi:hypothetical protein